MFDEWRCSTSQLPDHTCPAKAQTSYLCGVQLCQKDIEDGPKTTKHKSVDHEDGSLDPFQRCLILVIFYHDQKPQDYAHTCRDAHSYEGRLLSETFIDHNLCCQISQHFTDTEDDLIDDRCESDRVLVEL